MKWWEMSDFLTLFAYVSKECKEAFERKLRPLGIHSGQHFLLELLWSAQEELTIGEIASHLRVEDPSITRSVQRMERQGWVERHSHPTDARQVVVRLTPKGWDLQRIIPQLMIEGEAELLAHVSDVERALFIRVLEQMQRNLEQGAAQDS
jgi:DNA-binding MarR family transcriptional regulator